MFEIYYECVVATRSVGICVVVFSFFVRLYLNLYACLRVCLCM